MNQLSDRERELVAIGAAIGSNCASCAERHIPLARAAGLTDPQLEEAIELADAVRAASARKASTAASEALSRKGADDDHRGQGSACDQLGRPSRGCC
jgi:AhpD family alkylhydroperoxidase